MTPKIGRHDIQHNDVWNNDTQHYDIQYNDTQLKGVIYETQHKWHSLYMSLSIAIL